ncbi:MAG: response regulator [Methanoregula sp.]|nr:response regulator [Methanoregula sp.]
MDEKTSVLIVDDDESLCRTLSLVLKRKGYDVTVANSGLSAIEMVRNHPFDLIFMDIRMPGMDGVETLERIRKIRPDAVVMMMTAYALEDLIEKALYLGAQGILYKPIDLEKVITTIEDVTRKQPGLTILVVDDDEATAITLKNILTRHGHNVDAVFSGKDAIRMAQDRSHEIALIDMKLPDIDGLQVFLAMKKNDPDITVIMITGYRQEMAPLIETALKEAAYTVLYKPLDMRSLLTVVKEISKKKRLK